MAPTTPPRPKAIFFDVFGTCVDWRTTVTTTLHSTAVKLGETTLTEKDWALFADRWRTSYLTFTRELASASPSDPKPFKTVDQHHLDSLHSLLHEAGLGALFPGHIVQDLSLVWHRLAPWPDTTTGLTALNALGLQTATLTNGNVSLIQDLAAFAHMPFTHLLSAEMFASYKPNRKVYLGAAEKLGLEPRECGMVAAHLGDLKAAKGCGFFTVYVERPGEERDPDPDADYVDVWIREGGEGFGGVAEALARLE